MYRSLLKCLASRFSCFSPGEAFMYAVLALHWQSCLYTVFVSFSFQLTISRYYNNFRGRAWGISIIENKGQKEFYIARCINCKILMRSPSPLSVFTNVCVLPYHIWRKLDWNISVLRLLFLLPFHAGTVEGMGQKQASFSSGLKFSVSDSIVEVCRKLRDHLYGFEWTATQMTLINPFDLPLGWDFLFCSYCLPSLCI